MMKYLNQFHKEAMERTMKKIAESKNASRCASRWDRYLGMTAPMTQVPLSPTATGNIIYHSNRARKAI